MSLSNQQIDQLQLSIKQLALEYDFQDARVSDISIKNYFSRFKQWVADGYHGNMSFLERNHDLREQPDKLHPQTIRVISLRYNYLPKQAQFNKTLKETSLANISRYALGRDYHKILRKKLAKLCDKIAAQINQDFKFDYRVFVDSAPVLETAFAEKAGIGWKGKNSLIVNKDAGSWFFLAEIFTNLPLIVEPPVEDLCGNCTACITLCPTNAILEGKNVDATRCISYLTIENKGAIPVSLREKIGNRIYGCDDCQLACPWNRFSSLSEDLSFEAKNQLNDCSLLELWQWNEDEFLKRFEGSPIRRIGYQNWLRNIAVALGNSPHSNRTIKLLNAKKEMVNPMVLEHINWAITQLEKTKVHSHKLNNKTKKLINCVTNMLPRDA